MSEYWLLPIDTLQIQVREPSKIVVSSEPTGQWFSQRKTDTIRDLRKQLAAANEKAASWENRYWELYDPDRW